MAKPPETLVPLPQMVSLGVILDMPFLHQLSMPLSMGTVVESTLLPTRYGTSTTTYTFAAPGQPLRAVYEAATSQKDTRYHYDPADPEAMARELEAKIADLGARHDASRDGAERARLRDLQRLYRENLAKLRAQSTAGQAPMRLARQTWVEKGLGKATVYGEIVFEYQGLDIAKAHMTTRTDDDPPRVDKLTRSYSYDPLGRLTSMDVAGSITEFGYDPGGRLVTSSNSYTSPAGDFRADDQVAYLYAPPPGADPVAANALLMSIDDAVSGPVASFEPPLEAGAGMPEVELPEIERPAAQIPGAELPGMELPGGDGAGAGALPGGEGLPAAPGVSIPGLAPGLAGAVQQVVAGLDLPALAGSMEPPAGAPGVPGASVPSTPRPPSAPQMPSTPQLPSAQLPAMEMPGAQPPAAEMPGAQLAGAGAPTLPEIPQTPAMPSASAAELAQMPDVSSLSAMPEIPAQNLAQGAGTRMPAADVPELPATPGMPALELPKPDLGEDVTRVVNTYVYGPV